MKFDEVIYFNR